jgi:hypothetical protein
VCAGEATVAFWTANTNTQLIIPPSINSIHLHAAQISSGTVGWRLEESNDFVRLGDLEWEDYQTPGSAINPPGAVSDPAVDSVEADWPGTLLFSASATNMVAGVWQMQHAWAQGTPIRPHIHWMQTGANGGKAVWHLYYRRVSRTGASEDWQGPVVGADELTTGGIADREGITSFGSIDLSSTTSQAVGWKLYRMGGDGADTLSTTARLMHLDYHYQKDSLGSGAEYFK